MSSLNKTPVNPLSFVYRRDGHGFNFFHDFGKTHYVFPDDIMSGEKYLKMEVRHTTRTHDGYCSEYEFDPNDNYYLEEYVRADNIITAYFKVPMNLCDEDDDLCREYIGDDYILNTDYEDIKDLYMYWKTHSDCDGGSGVCDLYDSYTVCRITYVEIA